MRYNGIFRVLGVLMGAALVLALMVPTPGLAQTGTDDKTKATAVPSNGSAPTAVGVQSFADRFDSVTVRWVETDPVNLTGSLDAHQRCAE